jgi:hypothetical protein
LDVLLCFLAIITTTTLLFLKLLDEVFLVGDFLP